MSIHLDVTVETFPVAGTFTISRGSRTEIHVVTTRISRNGLTGRSECVPYPRYGESVEGVADAIRALAPDLQDGLTRDRLQSRMAPGAARNGVDCALWDLEARETGIPAFKSFGLADLKSVTTAYTLSLGTPESMEQAAAAAASRPLLKVKLGGDGDHERMEAVRRGAPESDLIVDANEAWTETLLPDLLVAADQAGVKLIEQPLPADEDDALKDCDRLVPICADESAHTSSGLDSLVGKYDAVNVKLDKTGGLTEARQLVEAARSRDLKIMVGCMLGTSLAMAPAFLVAQTADFVDLDGPLLLARDREHGLTFEGSTMLPPAPSLWG
ncbi:MAG: N-acetyl-D-Glu racemase DgcA [Pseudomonadota bacterium]